jgi:polyisoprenoid-binding protein YceI
MSYCVWRRIAVAPAPQSPFKVRRLGAPLVVSALVALAGCSPAGRDPVAPASGSDSIAPVSTEAPAGAYTLDKAHASLIFRVDHLGFSNFTARFRRFDAQLEFDPARPADANVNVTIDASSIETDYPDPATFDFNAMLQGDQWLNTARFPEIAFHSTDVELTGPDTMHIDGELELRGVKRPMALEATFNGGYAGHPMDKHARIGFSASGSLKRSEFGISFGVPTPSAPLGVGDDVDVIIEAEFNGPAWEQVAVADRFDLSPP